MSRLANGIDGAVFGAARFIGDPLHRWDLAALLIGTAIAWILAPIGRRVLSARFAPRTATAEIARRALDRLVLPSLIAIAAGVGYLILTPFGLPTQLLQTAAMLAASFVVIQSLLYGLTLALKPPPLLAASEHIVAWLIWASVALLILGWLHPLMASFERVAFTLGGKRFSLLDAASTVLTILVFLLIAAHVGGVIERRLMRAEQLSVGLKIGLAKTVRFALIILSALIAFNVLGVDLSGLTVFSGALGVGLGFGLQRIASNFVSGFILIGDRSIRPGDVITIGTRFGVVRELRARYVVVRDRDGVDTLIPNENLITSEVVNWSYSDRAVRLKLPVQISYQDDPRKAIAIMADAARRHPRIEATPEPAGRIMGFGGSGIDLELRVWIVDPEDGVNNVRSDLYLAIWDAFRETGITLPYPQRDVHLHTAAPPE